MYLDNSNISLNIPPLSTLKVIIKNKGVSGQEKGDLIVNLHVINNTSVSINKQDFIKYFGVQNICDDLVFRK